MNRYNMNEYSYDDMLEEYYEGRDFLTEADGDFNTGDDNMDKNELTIVVERKEIIVIERPVVEVVMGGAFCYDDNTTRDEFLRKLGESLKMVEAMGGMIPDSIEIVTDGEGRFAAKMKMGI